MNDITHIYSDRCWIGNSLQPATITIENGIIAAIHAGKIKEAEDMGDAVLMPGVIDAHVHINEPGRTDWEGFETATRAAAAGGVTMLVDMPLNSSPVTTSAEAFHEKLDAAKNKLAVNVGFYGGLVPGNYEQINNLMKAGVLGIKCFLVHSGIDEFPNVGEAEVDAAMPLIREFSIPLLAHCELIKEELADQLSADPRNYRYYLDSRPKKWENDAIELMISLCRKHRCKTHIVHVSSAESLESIRAAKAEGLPLTAETCSHYILFNAEDIPDADCLFKCAPPIREKANNDQLKAALESGILDFITTDHSPAPPLIKELESGNLQKAWGGIAGIQYLLPASWTALKDSMSLEKFIPLLTQNPARFLSLDQKKGQLAIGCDADITIWQPDAEFLVSKTDALYKHPISPYIGKKLFGKIVRTYVNGKTVFQDGKVINANSGMTVLKN